MKESAYFTIGNLNGKHDVKELKREISRIQGVISMSVNPLSNVVAVDFDNTGTKQDRIENRLKKIGYEINEANAEEHNM